MILGELLLFLQISVGAQHRILSVAMSGLEYTCIKPQMMTLLRHECLQDTLLFCSSRHDRHPVRPLRSTCHKYMVAVDEKTSDMSVLLS